MKTFPAKTSRGIDCRSQHWLLLCGLLVLLAPSCQQAASDAAAPPARQQQAASTAEVWDAFFLQGAKIGYGQTTIAPEKRDGRDLQRIRSSSHLEIKRFNQTTKQDVLAESLETPAGELLEFRTEVKFGPAPTITTGRVAGDQLELTVETAGRKAASRLPWSPDIRGFQAVEQSLAAEPLAPGKSRTLRMLVPVVNEVATVELRGQDAEATNLLTGSAILKRVDTTTKLSGGAIESTLWVDEHGDVLKTRIAALGQESLRGTREQVMAAGKEAANFDLGLDLIVKIDPPLDKAHEKKRVRYRVELTGGDAAKTFAAGPTQQVEKLPDGAAAITVTRLRPLDVPRPAETPAAAPPEYTRANSILQSDDAKIREMAREAKGTASDPADVAIALERYVHNIVGEKNFSHGFATAAEVARSREGDCTEHAVLLAALARACGLPSRVAIGLVYVDRLGGFGYHMWTEVYLRGQWIPLDGIMGQAGTSPAYLKLTDSSLDGASPYGSLLSVADVLGRLKVRVLEAD